MRHAWVYPLIIGFALGVLTRSFFTIGILSVCILLFIAFALLILGSYRTNTRAILISLACFSFAFGILRVAVFEANIPYAAVAAFFNTTINAEGVVVADPDERESNTKLTVLVDTVNNAPTSFRILLTVPRYPMFSYGDRIRFDGMLKEPETFSDDGVHIFNYPKWLLKDGIIGTMSFAKVEVLGHGKGDPLFAVLYKIKDAFLARIDRLIPEPESGLLAGLLVGSKQAMGKDLQDTFRTAGVVHVVVLSGYNVTIVASAVMRAFAFLPIVIGTIFGAGAMILFVLMVGASSTAIRATIMALLVLIARMNGRNSSAFRILLIAGFFMILQNPYILAFDPSFELSFLATLGLIIFSPYLEKKLIFMPESFGIRTIMVATLATQAMVLPFLLWMNGLFSIVAVPVNLLILGAIPPAMLLGFISGMIAFISHTVAIPFAFITELILRYQLFIVHLFASFPFAAITIPAFPFWLAALTYGAMVSLIVWRAQKKIGRA
jgi:competence protein ComEC